MSKRVLSIRPTSCKLVDMESLGQRVKQAMESQRPPLRGYQLAALMDRQQSYISKLINDQLKETPPPDVLQGIERVLSIPVPWSLRALGYDLEDASGEVTTVLSPFPPGSHAAQAIEYLKDLTEDDIAVILQTARHIAAIRASASDHETAE